MASYLASFLKAFYCEGAMSLIAFIGVAFVVLGLCGVTAEEGMDV